MSFRVGGDFFTPAVGRYVGQFTGIADGPVMDYPALDGRPARKGNTIKWFFGLYNLDGTPVIDTKTTALAVAEGLSSDATGNGRGTPAKARLWLTKMLESKGGQWVDPTSGEDVDRMVEFCKGVFVYLTFAAKPRGGTVLNEIERMQQPNAAPVAPPPVAAFPAATLAAFAPAPPAPVAAPLPVPAAVPFTPAQAPAPAATIPTMPFPAAQ